MAARFAPLSPAGVTTSCPGPCAVDVAMVDPLSAVLTTSCFILVRAAAVAEGVSNGDVTVGAGVAIAGAKEMTVAVFEVTGPRVVPKATEKLRHRKILKRFWFLFCLQNHVYFSTETPIGELSAGPSSIINFKGSSFSLLMCASPILCACWGF